MTSFDTIIDNALVIVNDYKLAKLYNQSVAEFQTYCDGFLINAIANFTQCNQDLSYDEVNREFSVDLTPIEINILAMLWVIAWWKKETYNASQIALKLKVSSSFTYNSESQNFKEKQNIIDKLGEEVNRKITDYLLLSLDSYQY